MSSSSKYPIFITLLLGLLVTLPSLTFGDTPEVVPAPPHAVIVENVDPIPVSGNVTATVTGEVQVENFDLQLTELIDEVSLLRDAVASLELQHAADFSMTFSGEVDGLEEFQVDLPVTVLASLITVSAENDNGRIAFCDTAGTLGDCDPNYVNVPKVLQFGSINKQFPAVLVVPIPQPIPVRAFSFDCRNAFEDCEITVTITGRVAE